MFEEAWAESHPLRKTTTLQKLHPTTFGTPANRHLKLKAAETKVFFHFIHGKLRTVVGMVAQGNIWLSAADSMGNLLANMKTFPWKLSLSQEQDQGHNRWKRTVVPRAKLVLTQQLALHGVVGWWASMVGVGRWVPAVTGLDGCDSSNNTLC